MVKNCQHDCVAANDQHNNGWLFQVTSLLKDAGVTNLTIQIEKETFFQHMQGLGTNFQDLYALNRERNSLAYGKSDFYKGVWCRDLSLWCHNYEGCKALVAMY